MEIPMETESIPFFNMSSTRDDPKTGVFWDLEDFPIPEGLDPATVFVNIKSALKKIGYPGEVFVWAYLPGGKTCSKHSQKEYVDAGITTISTREDKYGRINRMILDLLLWAEDNPPDPPNGPNVLVISKDLELEKADYFAIFPVLTARYYHVLLVLPDDKTTQNKYVKLKWYWRTLLSGGDPINETMKGHQVLAIGHQVLAISGRG